jgi:hypothetical protein
LSHFPLPECPPLGPLDDDETPLELPSGWLGDLFSLLPDRYVLSEEERDLASRYRNNDVSKGYLRSQIAEFRAPRSEEHHRERRAQLDTLKTYLVDTPWKLPDSFVSLCENHEYVNRIRHNNIWLRPIPTLVPPPDQPNSRAVQIFYEGQGCCYFSLLLADDGDHCVLYHEDPIVDSVRPPYAAVEDLDRVKLFRCCDSFDLWLAYYFVDCRAHDDNYNSMLKRFPGM